MTGHRLKYAIVEKRPLTASGYDEIVAWFTMKKLAVEYLKQQVPNARQRREGYDIVKVQGPSALAYYGLSPERINR